jgi:hypothetical protein
MQQVAFGKGNTMARFASWREMQQVDLHIAPCKRKVFGSIPKAGTNRAAAVRIAGAGAVAQRGGASFTRTVRGGWPAAANAASNCGTHCRSLAPAPPCLTNRTQLVSSSGPASTASLSPGGSRAWMQASRARESRTRCSSAAKVSWRDRAAPTACVAQGGAGEPGRFGERPMEEV